MFKQAKTVVISARPIFVLIAGNIAISFSGPASGPLVFFTVSDIREGSSLNPNEIHFIANDTHRPVRLTRSTVTLDFLHVHPCTWFISSAAFLILR